MKARLWQIKFSSWDSIVVNARTISDAIEKGKKHLIKDKVPKEYPISEVTLLAEED